MQIELEFESVSRDVPNTSEQLAAFVFRINV